MPRFDLIVLGLGGVGSSALYHAARRGKKVSDVMRRRGCVLRRDGLAEPFFLGGALSDFLQLPLCEELTNRRSGPRPDDA